MFPRVLKVIQPTKPTTSSSKDLAFEILYPQDFIPEDSPDQVLAMKAFIKDIGETTNCSHRQISIHEDWRKTAPVEEKDLRQYLYHSTAGSMLHIIVLKISGDDILPPMAILHSSQKS
ncbi:MAG: hypothetical protein Q9168_005340 [Polycauliona sp. 1 TL-2023]